MGVEAGFVDLEDAVVLRGREGVVALKGPATSASGLLV